MTEYYVVFETATGDIRSSGMGPDGAAALQDGALPEGFQTLVVPQAAIFGSDGIDTAAVLAALKARQSATVYAKRDTLIAAGCPIEGAGLMPTDEANKLKITGAVVMALASKVGAGTFEPIDWTLTDGTKTTFDADQTIAMGFAVGQREQACHKREQDLNDAITAAADIPAVLAIDITSGWPA